MAAKNAIVKATFELWSSHVGENRSKELMELENGLFLSTLSTASLFCTLVLQGLFYTLANKALLGPHSEIVV